MSDAISIKISESEKVWRLEDSFEVFKEFHKQKKIILGGDILKDDLQYNYDSWYYEPNDQDERADNVNNSHSKAHQYVHDYISKNGKNFYISIVTD